MATKIIQLKDGIQGGILVEAEIDSEHTRLVSSKDEKQKLQASVDQIKPILVSVCRPVIDAWTELNKDMVIDQAEVVLGLSFVGEGNLYVTKATASANLEIRLTLKPPPTPLTPTPNA